MRTLAPMEKAPARTLAPGMKASPLMMAPVAFSALAVGSAHSFS